MSFAVDETPDQPNVILPQVSLGLSRTTTDGGMETKAFYGPGDVGEATYEERLGDPGQFPFTRGAFPEMYRSRMWTLRNIVGYGTPADTRDGIDRARAAGQAGFNVVLDTVSGMGVDPDHPLLAPDVGLDGCSVAHLPDLERLLEGIDMTETDVAWHATHNIYPLVLALAEKQGLDVSRLQGSHMPDYLKYNLDGAGSKFMAPPLSFRMAADTLEHVSRHTPRWASGYPQMYNIRERGVSAVTEIALGMAVACVTFDELVRRGLTIDEVATSMAWVSTSDIDFFEEVSKFRALRRLWARTLSSRFGVTNPRALRLRIACHTSGRSLIYQQPLNNLTRTAMETFAAIAGGVQSVETCTYDEPVGLPTHEARELAIRQQLVLAHETGVARTADPFGGSYYVEALTDRIEAQAVEMQAKLEERGLVRSVEDGTIEALMDEYNVRRQAAVDSGDAVVIGVNAFVPEEEPAPVRFTFDRSSVDAYITDFTARKQARDRDRVEQSLRAVHARLAAGGNMTPPMVAAFVAGATVGEVSGTLRVASGLKYDPFDVVSCPVEF